MFIHISIWPRTSLLAELVSVPEPLDFSAADFTCNFLGGRIQAPGKELSLLRQFIDDESIRKPVFKMVDSNGNIVVRSIPRLTE